MNLRNVKLIMSREVRDQMRDRRTLFMIFVLPVLLYPLLGMSFLQISQFLGGKVSSVWVVGAKDLPTDPPLFGANKRFHEGLFVRVAKGYYRVNFVFGGNIQDISDLFSFNRPNPT